MATPTALPRRPQRKKRANKCRIRRLRLFASLLMSILFDLAVHGMWLADPKTSWRGIGSEETFLGILVRNGSPLWGKPHKERAASCSKRLLDNCSRKAFRNRHISCFLLNTCTMLITFSTYALLRVINALFPGNCEFTYSEPS